MNAININPLVVSVSYTAVATSLHPIYPTEHGGAVKKVIAVVAAIAIPFVAPTIAASIGLSGAVTAAATSIGLGTTAAATVGGVVGGAIVGAGLGAVSAAVTGQDVKAGAIAGGLGGGIAGGIGAYSTATAPTPPPTPAAPTVDATGVTAGTTTAAGPASVATGAPTAQAMGGAGTAATNASAQVVQTAAKTGIGTKLLNFVGDNTPLLASMMIQAGAGAMGQSAVPDPTIENSEELKALVDEYRTELIALKASDEKAFNEKMEAAEALLINAGYYDPTYFANLRAGRESVRQGRIMRDEERKASLGGYGNLSDSERRRMALQAGLNIGTAYDAGFTGGLQNQTSLLQAGAGAIPTASGRYATGLSNIYNITSNRMAGEVARADEQRQNIIDFYSQLDPYSQKAGQGVDDDEDDDDKPTSPGLDTSALTA